MRKGGRTEKDLYEITAVGLQDVAFSEIKISPGEK